MDDHHSKREIDNLIYEILKSSKSLDVFPTPIDTIIEYCELNLSNKSDFHRIPSNYVPKKIDSFTRMIRKILGAFDRDEKEIYIDPSLPHVKQNFVKLHETAHGVIPWQKEIKYKDNEYTLSPDVKDAFEAEANYFASGGLFQLNRFEDEMNKLPLEIGSPMALAKKFGGSNHAAIRRYAEVSKKRCCLLVLQEKNGNSSSQTLDLKNSFQSRSFTKEFGELTWPKNFNMDFPFMIDYNQKRRFHTDGTIQLLIHGEFIEFSYHYFNNHYNVFVLIIPVGEKNKSRTKIYLSP